MYLISYSSKHGV